MSLRFLPLLLLCAPLALAADNADKSTNKQASAEEIRARLHDHLQKKRAENAKNQKAPRETKLAESVSESIAQNPPGKELAKQGKASDDTKAEKEPVTVLPEVKVSKDRITELDRQVAKQNREIRREKQNTKPTALDETLNGPKTSKWLALFGGQSSEDRANVARERVAMMEDERDLLEAIDQAQTPEEKEQLQRTLDTMRAMRRDLEQALR